MDAFYLQAPFVKKVLERGSAVVIGLTQENRDLYKDVDGLCSITPPEALTGLDQTTDLQDLDCLTSWDSLRKPIRVVRALERQCKRERIAGKLTERQITRDWRWVTNVPQGIVSAQRIARWGHARWDEETRGFGELTQHWHLNHCYHHHPTALLAGLLILFLAFFLTTLFFDRNLKPPLRKGQTRLGLAWLLADDLVRGGRLSFWTRSP